VPGSVESGGGEENATRGAERQRRTALPNTNLSADHDGGERTEIGRSRKADHRAANSAERFDPEGRKSPEGEWKLIEAVWQAGRGSGNGLLGVEAASHRGKPGLVVEPKSRTGSGSSRQAREVAGREH